MTGEDLPRRLDYLPLRQLSPAEANPKAHDLDALRASVLRFGMIEVAAVLDERTGRMISGHGRLETLSAAEAAGLDLPEGLALASDGSWLAPVLRGWASADDAEAEAALVTVNETTIAPGWIEADLAPMLERISASRAGLEGTGYTKPRLADLLARLKASREGGGSDGEEQPPPGPSLADRFLVPPFSVLDARQGYWQERKRAWLDLGIESEIGRAENLLGMSEAARAAQGGEGTSVFDPVVCELAYRWWAGPGSRVLDPFAGGSVRGIVASMLGLDYTGIELRPEQTDANREQLATIGAGRDLPGDAAWITGDSRQVLPPADLPEDPEAAADLIFSCPPYFDLERYEGGPGDLSGAESYEAFLEGYREIIARAARQLAEDRFAVWVVGEIRDKDGICRGFVPDTIAAFEAAGLSLYNEAVLVTSVGSLAMRAARIFAPGRKLGRAHQAVLVFVKGDPSKAAEHAGPVEIGDPAELFGKVIRAEGPSDAPEAASEPQSAGSGAAPAWAKGRPLDELKAVAQLFQEHDEGLTLGAFSKVKENTVASWSESGQLLLLVDEDDRPCAAAAIAECSGRRRISDFGGRLLGQQAPGHHRVARFAARPGFEQALADALLDRAQGAPLWLDAWQEHPRDRAILGLLGAAWRGTKIRASSELIGVWLVGESIEPAEPTFWDGLGLALSSIEFDPFPLLDQIDALGPAWADHYSSYNEGHSWSALALRGYGGRPGFIEKPAEMSKAWKAEHPDELTWELADTGLRSDLPAAEELISLVPGEHHRVRLMRLAPGGGELTRHADITDPDAGISEGALARIHLPLRTNEGVRFQSWLPDGSRCGLHMPAGRACYLDTRKPHTAINGGESERIHLVIDAVVTTDLLQLLREPAPIEQPAPEPAQLGEQKAARPRLIVPS